jgi:hypothetical protein
MKIAPFWYMLPSSLLDIYRRFGWTLCLHLHARNLFHAAGRIFLQHVPKYLHSSVLKLEAAHSSEDSNHYCHCLAVFLSVIGILNSHSYINISRFSYTPNMKIGQQIFVIICVLDQWGSLCVAILSLFKGQWKSSSCIRRKIKPFFRPYFSALSTSPLK